MISITQFGDGKCIWCCQQSEGVHRRRALSPWEVAKLVESARSSSVKIQCFDGEQRARIYILSYMTGLRRKEIASLTPRSFSLDDEPAIVRVEAACSKHRKMDVLPLQQFPLTIGGLQGLRRHGTAGNSMKTSEKQGYACRTPPCVRSG